jgi:hypothetical protein
MNLCMIMFVLCICLSFGSIFHLWETTCGHSDWDEVESQCSFYLHFLLSKDVEYFFICLLAICFFLRIVCSIHLPIYSVGCWFFKRSVFELPVYSGH